MKVCERADSPFGSDVVLFFAAGFEERAFEVARRAVKAGRSYRRVVLITYLPRHTSNRMDEARELAERLSKEPVKEVVFDRFAPGDCKELLEINLRTSVGDSRALVDISGMSRFLVALLVVRLGRAGKITTIAYTEPGLYRPSEEEVRAATDGVANRSDLIFLTTGLYGIAAVEDLTTASMQGYPEVLVASPSFEPRFLRALLSELSPAKFVLLEGVPRDRVAWRRNAVRDLNEFAFEIADEIFSVPTDGIEEGRRVTWDIFAKYKYSHRMVLVPAPSKLVAVGQALAILEGLEAEVVYPTPQSFSDPYSDGASNIRCFDLEHLD